MADLIKIKGGSGDVPNLQERELAYSKDKEALYIGTDDGNVKVGDKGWEARITALENGLTGDTTAIIARVDAIETNITSIISRLDALENPSE